MPPRPAKVNRHIAAERRNLPPFVLPPLRGAGAGAFPGPQLTGHEGEAYPLTGRAARESAPSPRLQIGFKQGLDLNRDST
jgi:hypothetical protein